MKNKITNILSIGLSAIVLTSCATIDDAVPGSTHESIRPKVIDAWNSEIPAIRKVNVEKSIIIQQPNRIPAKIKNIEVDLDLATTAGISDLEALLANKGVYLSVSDESLRNKSLLQFKYKGKLGYYLDSIAKTHGLEFIWSEGDIISLVEKARYRIRIPQNSDLQSDVTTTIASMGAEDISVSKYTGTVDYKASKKDAEHIKKYISRYVENASLLNMQVAIIQVALNDSEKSGIDWSSTTIGIGSHKNSVAGASNNGSVGATLFGGALSLSGIDGGLGLSTALDFLSLLGTTETVQDLTLKTVSGKQVKVESVKKIPYASSVLQSGSSDNDQAVTNIKVENINLGLELMLDPWYDADSNVVSMDVDMRVSNLIQMVDLHGGKGLDVISYPSTQEQTMTDTIKIKAGESVLIGGITYESNSDNRQTPSFLSKLKLGHSSREKTKSSMYILLRPTVTTFGNFESEEKLFFGGN